MRFVRAVGIVTLALLLSAVMLAVAVVVARVQETDARQSALAPFYVPPDPLPSTPGTLVRSEAMDLDVTGGRAYRILYVSTAPDGSPVASSGMAFLPSTDAPVQGRPVVAWAHPTTGLGDACAPSRSANPLALTRQWIEQMLGYGWVVVATDYVGLGTPGPTYYLVGESEAADVANSVRAVRQLPDADAGTRWIAYGHSQGGHAALWTGHLAERIAPELDLLGVAAAAPAAELSAIVTQQWDQLPAWVIGPEVVQDWPQVYPGLQVDGVVTDAGVSATQTLAQDCLLESGLDGLARTRLGQRYFGVDPLTTASWRDAMAAQTPRPLPPTMPAFLGQGTDDEVVLANTNALMQERWCAAGSSLTVDWLGTVNHNQAGAVSGPAVAAWAWDLFAGRTPTPNCTRPPPPVAGYDGGR